jgi:hypothetical protein
MCSNVDLGKSQDWLWLDNCGKIIAYIKFHYFIFFYVVLFLWDTVKSNNKEINSTIRKQKLIITIDLEKHNEIMNILGL